MVQTEEVKFKEILVRETVETGIWRRANWWRSTEEFVRPKAY